MSNLPVEETFSESWDMVLFLKETKNPLVTNWLNWDPFIL